MRPAVEVAERQDLARERPAGDDQDPPRRLGRGGEALVGELRSSTGMAGVELVEISTS